MRFTLNKKLKRNNDMKKLIIAAVAALSVGLGFAGSDEDEAKVGYSPVGIGFVTPAQYPSARANIYGLRLSLPMSINKDVCGLDLGVVGLTSGGIYGLQVTPFNWSDGGANGMQIAGLANVIDNNAIAMQVAPFNMVRGDAAVAQIGVFNYAISYIGLQMGVLNWNCTQLTGSQIGAINVNAEEMTGFFCGALNYCDGVKGFQLGVINVADRANGLQIGAINAVNEMSGLQIGFINMICESALPLMVIANASF
jgi:hypothetical protein